MEADGVNAGILRRLQVPIAAALIVVACLAAYSNTFRAPFVFDDDTSIRDNPTIRHLWPIARVLSPPGEGRTVQGRPILNLSLAVSWAISGMRTWGYHLVNLLVLALSALALFGIVRRTLLLPAAGPRAPNAATALGAAVALLWAVHPLQTAAVTYIVQRAESLYGLLCLTTLYGFLRGAVSARRAAAWYVLSVLACLTGMFTKESMVVAPVLVLLFDRVFLARSFAEAMRWRTLYYAGLAACWIALLILVIHTGSRGGTAGFGAKVTPWAYAVTQPRSVVTYLRLAVWPSPLVFDYGTPLAKRASEIVPYAIVVIALLAATALAFRRRPWLGFLGAWFFITLAPSSSFVPSANQTMAEHRMYLPLAAVISLLVIGGAALGKRLFGGRRLPAIAPALVLAVLLGGVTHSRNRVYASVQTLWSDTIAKRPDNARAYNNRGMTYEDSQTYDRAAADFTKAIETDPQYATAYYNRGNVRLHTNQFDAAIADYDRALALKPDHVKALVNRGVAYASTGNYEHALQDYTAAIALAPGLADAYNNRAAVYYVTGDYARARADIDACALAGGVPNPRLVQALRVAMGR